MPDNYSYYVAHGNSGKTYGVHHAGLTMIQIEYPSGDLGTPGFLEDHDNWSLPRWKAQHDVEEVSQDTIPGELLDAVERADAFPEP